MKNLKELYESKSDVRDSQIPTEWKESFNKFIFGQTCYMEENENGEKEFVYYSHDFRYWYNKNKEAIERDLVINEVLNIKL
jgi:hypothetical protein